ncbi:GNAT family N-acetyltransferase [Alteromonas sp. ASW11-36]|uniref:GNAT family N-acetyltransferase n=1 Tax=Alteromonas arenosi TaxID=3055817 RepID=A0ABT7SVM1_9ALTE|nr:GNAT family N-acetyltransferase [Alteromonas sp. ASW11-36]MDM7860059.1 GNAT family N-acetyltransferase [Alteromonas sp. ASW11-36]
MIAVSDAVKQIDEWLTQRCQSVNHRQLLMLCGEKVWQQAIAEYTIDSFQQYYGTELPCSWYGERLSNKAVLPHHPNHLIGQQTLLVTYNASERLAAKHFLVLAGTIVHQGLLVVLSPSLATWRHSLTFLAKQSYGTQTSGSAFATYLQNMIVGDSSVAIIEQQSGEIRLPLAPVEHVMSVDTNCAPFATSEQRVVGTAMKAKLAEGENYILSLTARRGRGKTWLLGWLCSAVLAEAGRVAVVSSRASAIKPLFAQTDASKAQQNLRFYPPDSSDLKDSDYDLLVIDEVASIPIPLLLTLCQARCNCILSTTIDGYEGTGQGFLHRLLPEIQSRYRHYNAFQLEQPLRWHLNDSLENLLTRVFCLSATIKMPESQLNTSDFYCRQVCSTELLEQPELFRQVFALLKLAHYQTTAEDLIRLLDSPEQLLFLAYVESQVVGVLVIIEEGNSQVSSLREEISSGQRRVAGHMSLQLCAFNTRAPEFCDLKLWRVNRIAVASPFRRRGIASALLDLATQCAREHQQIDAITTLFGSQPEIEQFWQQSGFSFYYRGRKTNKASNAENVLYVSPISRTGKHCFNLNKTLTPSQHKAKIRDYIAGYRAAGHCQQSFAWFGKNANDIQTQQIMQRLSETSRKLRITDFAEFGFKCESQIKEYLRRLINVT